MIEHWYLNINNVNVIPSNPSLSSKSEWVFSSYRLYLVIVLPFLIQHLSYN